ncbi:MAG: hypothetical protein QOH24_219 [Verrucomicrobiota bacterium]|jgi:hypothetical protein
MKINDEADASPVRNGTTVKPKWPILLFLGVVMVAGGCADYGPHPGYVAIEIGDRPYYIHGPGYYVGRVYYVWRPGRWVWRQGRKVWIHGRYILRG